MEQEQNFPVIAVINLGALVLNIIVFIANLYLNFRTYDRRKKNERIYQSSFSLFNTLIINRLDDLINFGVNIEKNFLELIDKLKNNTNKELIISIIEESIEKQDKLNDEFNREVILIVQCYSSSFKQELKKEVIDFYDNTTTLFTRLSITQKDQFKTSLNNFVLLKEKYLENLFELVKKYKPSMD